MSTIVRILVTLAMTLSMSWAECQVTAYKDSGPDPDPSCVGERILLHLTGDVTPTTHSECKITENKWLWEVKSLTLTPCGSSPSDQTSSKSGGIDIKSPKKMSTKVEVKKGTFDQPGTWTVVFKATANVKTTCGDCTDTKDVSVDFHVIDFEIQVNKTATADDDYVQIKGEICPHVYTTPCQVKVVGCPPGDVPVTLVNPDDRLGFPTDQKISLTLPASGAWVDFPITGQDKSKKVGDAKIELHHGGSDGPVCKKQTATVFWFNKDSIKGERGNRYVYDPVVGAFNASPYPAVTMRGHAELQPDSANCAAPQITNLVVGMVQNSLRLNYSYNYKRPQFVWTPQAVKGDVVSYPREIDNALTVPGTLLDSATNGPLYDMTVTNAPAPCGTGDSYITDNPGFNSGLPAEHTTLDLMAHGVVVARVTYDLVVEVDVAFMSWTVIYDTVSGGSDVTPLIRRGWDVDAVSTSHPGDRVSIDFFSHRSTCPVTTPPTANTALADPANFHHSNGALVTRTK